MTRTLLWLCCLMFSAQVLAFENFDPIPGGIAGVSLGEFQDEAPRAFFGRRELTVLRHAEGWVALVGLSRNLTPGLYVVNSIDSEDHYQSHTFAVRAASRPIYTVESPKGVDPGELVRRQREGLEQPLPAAGDEQNVPDLDFILPVELDIRHQFGLLRINGSSHILPFPGLGFAGSRQAAVVNPAFGQVLRVEEGNNGSRMVISHGGGLISVFRNLGSVAVSGDEWLPQGALLGNLPARTRVHLLPDWSVYLNGVEIDPLLLVSRRIDLAIPPQ